MIKTKSLMVISRTPQSGMRLVMMGIMGMLKREVLDIAIFKPLVESLKKDDDIEFFIRYFKLKQSITTASTLNFDIASKLLSINKQQDIYERILSDYEKLIRKHDFVLIQGMVNLELEEIIGFDINFEIAKNLQIPTVELINAKGVNSVGKIQEYIDYLINLSKRSNVRLLGIFVNRLNPKLLNSIRSIKRAIPIFAIPEIRELNSPTILDILNQTKANLVTSEDVTLDRTVYQVKIATMQLQNYLEYLENGDLVVVSKDRFDIIIGTLIANYSKNYPSIAGILLTGKMPIPSTIDKLIDTTNIPSIPILSLDTDTQSAVNMVSRVEAKITLENKRKIALVEGIFIYYIDLAQIKKYLLLEHPKVMTPIRFTYYLYKRAKESNSNILLTESDDERILRATDIILRRNICNITLLGKKDLIEQRSSALGLDLSRAKVIDPQNNLYTEQFVNKFYELRRHKGLVRAVAKDLIAKPNYFATMMVYFGYVDGLVSGATHTTRETIKPAFEIIKAKSGVKLISSLFFMLLNDRVLVYADCAINVNPTAEELAHIAVSSANTAKEFGIEPIVAMLSYSSGCSGIGRDVEKVREATKIAQSLAPNIPIEGPMQYDTAIDIKVAKQKMPTSRVAGRATVFIFPDLNTGNNTYKAVQRSTKSVAIGPILQGLKRPFNDLSRGCTVEDIVHTVAITAVQAGNKS